MTTIKTTIKNNFHGTEITLNAQKTERGYLISKSQVIRARRELCGISNCTCGDELGQRVSGNNGFFIVPQIDGSCLLIEPIIF